MIEPLIESYWPADLTVPLVEQTVGDLLRNAVAAAPDRVALVDGRVDPTERRQWTYAELLAAAEATARALLARFSPGDRVALWAPNSAEWVIAQQGISLAGMVLVPLNPNYRSQELTYALNQSRAAGLIHADAYRGFDMSGLVTQIRPDLTSMTDSVCLAEWADFIASGDPATPLPAISPSDPLQIQYTSGTTGFPKGALLRHHGVTNASSLAVHQAQLKAGGVYVNAMPMYHIGGGAVTELGTFSQHGTFVLLPDFDPGLVLELIEAYRGTHTLLVPTMLLAVLDHPSRPGRDVSSLEVVMSGATPVPAALVARTKETLDCGVIISFGQTELHGIISQTQIDDTPEDQADTIGRPMPQVEVRIIDPATGATQPIGEPGEICARGYQARTEYFELPEASAQLVDAEGWLHTGDLGSMDERGYLRITGRLKDMIIRGGMNLFPREIEELLSSHPQVAEASVIGVPDERWGEQVGAVIRAADPANPPSRDELNGFCRERIAGFKTPTLWYSVDAYPMTPSGKIQKFKLLESAVAGALRPLGE